MKYINVIKLHISDFIIIRVSFTAFKGNKSNLHKIICLCLGYGTNLFMIPDHLQFHAQI